jgi:K+-transporting ATPase ATPase C chain
MHLFTITVRQLLFWSLVLGGLYPLSVTLCSQILFPTQANGSLVSDQKAQIVGSKLIGQSFRDKRYFWSRPSSTAPGPYETLPSTGSNWGPSNPEFQSRLKARILAIRNAHPGPGQSDVPIDLVTGSASGLDPEISLAAAYFQVDRIAQARTISPDSIRKLISRIGHGSHPWILMEPGINVLELNLALDQLEAQ